MRFYYHRTWFISIGVLLLLMTGATAVFGYGAVGETDLLITPTTRILNQNALGVAVNFTAGDYRFFNFDFGFTPELEAGLAISNNPDRTHLSFRGKYRLLRDTSNTPSLIVGIQDVGRGFISPYVTLGKVFYNTGVRGYLGVGGGSFNGVFGGISKTFHSTQGNNLELLLEADSYGLNLGGKLLFADSRAKVNFGLVDLDRWVLGLTFVMQ